MGTKGTFDLMFDRIEAALETYSAGQPAGEEFTVKPDRYRGMAAGEDGAFVFLYLGPLIPTQQGGQAYFGYDADYILDLVVAAKGSRSYDIYTSADEATGIRLRYLIKQVMEALFPAGDRNLGMASGTVAKKLALQVSPLPPEMQLTERPFAGARLTLNIGLSWSPELAEGEDLESISVTADKWSALIEP